MGETIISKFKCQSSNVKSNPKPKYEGFFILNSVIHLAFVCPAQVGVSDL